MYGDTGLTYQLPGKRGARLVVERGDTKFSCIPSVGDEVRIGKRLFVVKKLRWDVADAPDACMGDRDRRKYTATGVTAVLKKVGR